jgi:hypothetical protein
MEVIFIVTEYKISRLPAFFSGFSLGSIFAEKIEFSLTAGVVAPPPTRGADTCTQ